VVIVDDRVVGGRPARPAQPVQLGGVLRRLAGALLRAVS
jgi:hypothetical protein